MPWSPPDPSDGLSADEKSKFRRAVRDYDADDWRFVILNDEMTAVFVEIRRSADEMFDKMLIEFWTKISKLS